MYLARAPNSFTRAAVTSFHSSLVQRVHDPEENRTMDSPLENMTAKNCNQLQPLPASLLNCGRLLKTGFRVIPSSDVGKVQESNFHVPLPGPLF